jgi:hypothetical protein
MDTPQHRISAAVSFATKPVFKARVSIVAIVAVLMTGMLPGGDARAVTDTVFNYSEPRTGHLMLGPPDFAPYRNDVNYSINEGLAISATSNNEACLYASVHLPQSATITQMRAFYGRPTEGDVLFVVLRRLNAAPTGIVTVANYPPATTPLTQRGSVTYPA